MKLRKLLVAVLAVFAGLTQAQQMPPIPNDPDVRIGKLDNGLTYYIRHNNCLRTEQTSTSHRRWAQYRKKKASADWHTSWSTCALMVQSTSLAMK